ncbi:MAG TPA: hypothetical protein EYP14_16710 [Planctomycetaceae bacterium]|nr:hypothetical protein [Planctomycetaceae bacterium]
MNDGGVLFGTLGAGLRDEYNQPLRALDPVFGIMGSKREFARDAGRPLYEMRKLTPLNTLLPVADSGLPQVRMNQLCSRETLTPRPNAQTVFKLEDGSAGGVLNRYGAGLALRLASFPGVEYIHDAVTAKEYWGDLGRKAPYNQMPRKFRPALRDLIAWPANHAGAVRVAECDAPIVEFTRYDSPEATVVFIIDHDIEPRANFRFTLPDAARFRHARSARGRGVRMRPRPNGKLQIELSLDMTDIIVLTR